MIKKPSPKVRTILITLAIIVLTAIIGVSIYLGIIVAPLDNYFSSLGDLFSESQDTEPTVTDEDQVQYTREMIDTIVTAWSSGEMTYYDTANSLNEILENSSAYVATYAREQLAFIVLEENGNISLGLAESILNAGRFTQVLDKLNSIDPEYSKYSAVLAMYAECQNQVLQSVANPTTKEEYEAYIQLLDDCNTLHPTDEFATRKQDLEDELTIFLDISETIDASTKLFDNGHIEESLILLALGLEKYPDNDRLATTLVDYRDHYIISTTMQAVERCEQEEYKEALQLVENAIAEYDCPEFQALKKAIREEKNFLYRWKNNVVEGFNAITSGWTAEEFDVKQAAGDTGAYIVKSGKKLALGDYSDEDITLLSFGGNVAASLLGADVLFDLRDLSYDLTHWGEEEYFAVWLAADMVALLPVIGVVKYLSHFKTAANGVDAATDLVDSVADVSKNADNAADLVDAVSDVTKAGDDIVNAIDNAKDAARVGETAKDTAKQVVKGYTLIETINQNLLGKVHEKTGVKFVLRKIDLSDGKKIKGVFPVFDSFADVHLPKNLYKESFAKQQKECLKQLQKDVKNPLKNTRKNFTEDQLKDIADGILPDGFTWHHNEKEGLMQLVDTLIHDQTAHTGGMSIWGIGY